jgi:hypothetical protein
MRGCLEVRSLARYTHKKVGAGKRSYVFVSSLVRFGCYVFHVICVRSYGVLLKVGVVSIINVEKGVLATEKRATYLKNYWVLLLSRPCYAV